MSKMQNVSFRDINDFLEYLPEAELAVVDRLREIVLSTIPRCKEKLSYNVPYYYCYSRICFIWPASVPWGKVKNEGVILGLCRGHLISKDLTYFELGSRKEVSMRTFFSPSEINEEMIRMYLQEAVAIDEQYKKLK